MFELLSTKTGITLPWSGPGIKRVVKGSRSFGYFGSISAGEIALPNRLRADFGLTATPSEDFTYFEKFIINDRVLFVPPKPLTGLVTYQQLFNNGLVFGLDRTSAKIPGNLPWVKQDKWYVYDDRSGRTWAYVPRTFRFYDDDNLVYDPENEFTRIFRRLIGSAAERWTDNLPSNVTTGFAAYFDKQAAGTATYSTRRQPSNYTSAVAPETGSYNGANAYYWPIMELVPLEGVLLPLSNVAFVNNLATTDLKRISEDSVRRPIDVSFRNILPSTDLKQI